VSCPFTKGEGRGGGGEEEHPYDGGGGAGTLGAQVHAPAGG
jgi:hypothetical protein